MFINYKKVLFTQLIFGLSLQSAQAAQLDIMPDDYVVKPDTLQISLTYLNRNQTGNYVDGQKIKSPLGNVAIDTDVASLRISRFIELGNFTFAPVAVFSYRDIETTTPAWQKIIGRETQGVKGDLAFGGTLFFINKPEQHEYAGVTAFLTLPTGDYDAKKNINLSENRYKFVLSGNWTKPLGERWINEIQPEVAWYGDNDEFRDYTKFKYLLNPNLKGQESFSQNISYAITDTIRYKITPQLQAFLGAQFNRGGKSYVNDVAFGKAPENTRMMLGSTYTTESGNQWLVRYSRDVEIENGLRNSRELTVRYMQYF